MEKQQAKGDPICGNLRKSAGNKEVGSSESVTAYWNAGRVEEWKWETKLFHEMIF